MLCRTIVLTSLLALVGCGDASTSPYAEDPFADPGFDGISNVDGVQATNPSVDSQATNPSVDSQATNPVPVGSECSGAPALGGAFTVSRGGSIVLNSNPPPSGTIAGSGSSGTVERALGSFTTLSVIGTYRVEVRVGSPQSVVVTTDENLIPYIQTTVTNGKLTVTQEDGVPLKPTIPMVIRIAAPQLSAVYLFGASIVDIANLNADRFTAKVRSNNLCLQGEANSLDLTVDGGDCHAANLRTKAVIAQHYGENVDVCATEELTVELRGDGTVAYSCSPKKVVPNVVGSGKVVEK